MQFKTAAQNISQVAVEIGLAETSDPWAEQDPAYSQLIASANRIGLELIEECEWQILRREERLQPTAGGDPDLSGIYDLPPGFMRMIPQTGWERSNRVPLFGPASAQAWQYLEGRNLVSSTIYAIFRLTEGKLYLYPQPVREGLDIAYEYVSDWWVDPSSDPGTYANELVAAGDTVLYPANLFQRGLKWRYMEDRGFDTTATLSAYRKSLEHWMGADKSAPILRPDGHWGYPYLHGLRNTPDSGYGIA